MTRQDCYLFMLVVTEGSLDKMAFEWRPDERKGQPCGYLEEECSRWKAVRCECAWNV